MVIFSRHIWQRYVMSITMCSASDYLPIVLMVIKVIYIITFPTFLTMFGHKASSLFALKSTCRSSRSHDMIIFVNHLSENIYTFTDTCINRPFNFTTAGCVGNGCDVTHYYLGRFCLPCATLPCKNNPRDTL